MFKQLKKEIKNMSNTLFGIFVILIEFLLCCLIVTIGTISMNDDLIKKITKLEYENTELKWELEQVDQMVCNNEVQND